MKTKRVTSGPGTEIFVPDADGDDRCFDEPLPCTPQIGIQIMRDPDHPGRGYTPPL